MPGPLFLLACAIGAAILAKLVGRSFWRSLIVSIVLMIGSFAVANSLGYDVSGAAVIFAGTSLLILIVTGLFARLRGGGNRDELKLSDDERQMLDTIYQVSHGSTGEMLNRTNVVVAARFKNSYGKRLLRSLYSKRLVEFRPIGYLVITEAGIMYARSAQGVLPAGPGSTQSKRDSAPPPQPIRVVPSDSGAARN